MPKKYLNRIIIDPRIMVGKPVIKGTRIPVDLILKLLAQGEETQNILKDYPKLTRDDIRAALWYGSEVVRSEEIFPQLR